jgi:hypothetical protein
MRVIGGPGAKDPACLSGILIADENHPYLTGNPDFTENVRND